MANTSPRKVRKRYMNADSAVELLQKCVGQAIAMRQDAFFENESHLLGTQSEISEDDDDDDDDGDAKVDLCTEALGLLIQMKRYNFSYILADLKCGCLLSWTHRIQSESVDKYAAFKVVVASLESLKVICMMYDCWTELSGTCWEWFTSSKERENIE